jgi:hypothetical protein
MEDQHKTWKRSGSDVEQRQLQSVAARRRWMAIHAAVGARARALTHQARDPATGPQPATAGFSTQALTARRAWRATRGLATPRRRTLAEAVVLVAILGGYMPARNRPPGPKILRRGLARRALGTQTLDGLAAPQTHQKVRRK